MKSAAHFAEGFLNSSEGGGSKFMSAISAAKTRADFKFKLEGWRVADEGLRVKR